MPERPPLRTEVLAGVTTFVTMAYIVFVQPAVLGAAGMDPGAVFMATCLASAIATALMGWLADYPIAVGGGHRPQKTAPPGPSGLASRRAAC